MLVAERFRSRFTDVRMRRLIPWLAVAAICAAVVVVAVRFGSFVAGGSDSYCYVHQAERWASGRLLEPGSARARGAVARRAADVRACRARAVADRAWRHRADLPVRACRCSWRRRWRWPAAPAMFAVVPLCGVLLVVATFLLGRATGRRGWRGGRGGHGREPDRPVSGHSADERRAGRGVLDAGARACDPRAAGRRSPPGVCRRHRHSDPPEPRAARVRRRRLYLLLRPGAAWSERLRDSRALRHRLRGRVRCRRCGPAALLRLAVRVGLRRRGRSLCHRARRAQCVALLRRGSVEAQGRCCWRSPSRRSSSWRGPSRWSGLAFVAGERRRSTCRTSYVRRLVVRALPAAVGARADGPAAGHVGPLASVCRRRKVPAVLARRCRSRWRLPASGPRGVGRCSVSPAARVGVRAHG